MRISAVAYGMNTSKAIQVGGMEYEAASGSEATLTDCLDPQGGG